MGSNRYAGVFRRGAGWAYKVDVGRDPATGKRQQRMVGGFATQREAKEARDEAQARVRAGSDVAPSRVSVAEYLRRWLAGLNVREATLANYRQSAQVHAIPRIGGLPLQALTAEHLDALYRELERSGRRDGGPLAPKTVRHVHTMLRKALQDAVERGHLLRNVADQANPPTQRQARSRNAEQKVWTGEQLRTFLAHVEGDRLYALWMLLATTGLRNSEVCALRWTDLDLDAGWLTVAQTVTVTENRQVWQDVAKSEAGERRMALDADTVTALRARRAAQNEERLAFGPDWRDHERGPLVFTLPGGRPVSPVTLLRTLHRHADACGLPRIDVHGLRHSYATAALRAGVSPEVLSKRLGHADVATTLSIYAHVRPEDDAEAARQAAAYILGG